MRRLVRLSPVPVAVFSGPQQRCVAASKPWQELFTGGCPEELQNAVATAYRSRTQSMLRLSVAGRAFRTTLAPLYTRRVIATCIDETALVEAERARESARRVVSVVSHDLRAPMGTILLWERVLRDRFDDPEVRARALDAIRASIAEQTELIARLVAHERALDGGSERI